MIASDTIQQYLGDAQVGFTPLMAEAFLAFEATEQAKSRVAELNAKSDVGTITAEELAELERFLQLDELMAILKARSRQLLDNRG